MIKFTSCQPRYSNYVTLPVGWAFFFAGRTRKVGGGDASGGGGLLINAVSRHDFFAQVHVSEFFRGACSGVFNTRLQAAILNKTAFCLLTSDLYFLLKSWFYLEVGRQSTLQICRTHRLLSAKPRSLTHLQVSSAEGGKSFTPILFYINSMSWKRQVDTTPLS